MTAPEHARTILRDELRHEADAGFPLLSKIPATHIVQFVDYYSSLALSQQAALIDALVRTQLGEEPGYAPQLEIEQMRNVFGRPGPFVGGWRYTDIRFLHKMPGIAEFGGVDNWLRHYSGLALLPRRDLLPDTANFTPARAPLLRKLVGAVLKSMGFNGSRSSGEMRYVSSDGSIFGCDFGARMGQLRWQCSRGEPLAEQAKLGYRASAYETIWHLRSDWDYLTEENAERCVALLPILIERKSALEDRLAMR